MSTAQEGERGGGASDTDIKDGTICAVCHVSERKAKLKKCGACQVYSYCGTACQKQHWVSGGHKNECLKKCRRCTRVVQPGDETCRCVCVCVCVCEREGERERGGGGERL
jgi:hypothetical protein